MKDSKLTLLHILGTLIFLGPSVLAQRTPTTSPGLESLSELLFEDRSGDEVIDFVKGNIRLGENATGAEIAAASDVAARLGYETLSMDLPLIRSNGMVLIGARAVHRVGLSLPDDLSPGEGVVFIAQMKGREYLVLAGPDDAGTRAATHVFAGRLPYLWDPNGKTLTDVRTDLKSFLEDHALIPRNIKITRVMAKSNERALSRINVQVHLVTSKDVKAASKALSTLSRRHSKEGHAFLSYRDAQWIHVTLTDGERSENVQIPSVAGAPKLGPVPTRPGSGPKHDLDLSNLYTPSGLLGDSDSNHIPDRIDAVLSPAGDGTTRTVTLAARLGLESTGISVPIVRLPSDIEEAGEEPTLVLTGMDHPLVDKDRLQDLAPGQGWIEVVPNAFGLKAALIITGGDAVGVDRALEQVSERFPHLWERGNQKNRPTLDDVEMELWKFLSARSPAGQAATALYKLDKLVESIAKKDIAAATILLSLEKPAGGLDQMIRERLASLSTDSIDVIIDNRDVQQAATLLDEQFELPSEVNEFHRLFQERVLPRVQQDQPVSLEVRLSEPPEVLERLAEKSKKALLDRGALAKGTEVHFLSAFKQGYSWLNDIVRPQIEQKRTDLGEIIIHFKETVPPEEWPQQAIYTPVRWLHEIFPIDEILERELRLDRGMIRFEMAPPDAPTYEIVVRAKTSEEIFRDTFEPKVVLRPYLDRFRDYEMVRVTTGWITAQIGNDTVIDQRIATDPERFWDHYQASTLPFLYDYVMERHENTPRGNGLDAPLFGELTVDLELSEPHYLLDLDKEIISPMDALHEDIYFTTLTYFRMIGRNTYGKELTYPGRVLPIMRPKSDGMPGTAKISITGFSTNRPAVIINYKESDGQQAEARLDIHKVQIDRPKAMAASMRSGEEGIEELRLRVKVDTENNERDRFITITRAEQVDENIISAEQVVAMIKNLEQLRARGLYREALAYPTLGRITVAAGWEHDISPKTEKVATLVANGNPSAYPDINRYLDTPYEKDGKPIVQWQTPIPPPEAYKLLAQMSTFDESIVYKMGETYLGKEIWAMDLTSPRQGTHWSQYKATTLKPTVMYSAREHANEVSSTSHVLKLAELLLTDPNERKKLSKVNVVVHPITNADGAQLAYDLYEITPELILHAGYLGSLGMGVSSDSTQPMPLYPEAAIRPALWRTWLPDIFLNPHGYPSHQVVQLFSGYTGLVRQGRGTERNWSMNKGWFLPSFNYLDDPRYPRHKEAAFKIRDYIVEAINAAPKVYAMNQRNYDRYGRYGNVYDSKVFKLPMVDEVLIHTAIKGSRVPDHGVGNGFNPKITIWSGVTEAPDETAHGDWLELVATAGLQWDKAILQYLVDGKHKVERNVSEFFGGVNLSLDRPRPPKPEELAEKKSPNQFQ